MAKSVRYGELLSTSETSQPRWKDWSTDAAISEGFKANAWVFAAVSRIAKAASSVPWRAYDMRGDEAEEIDDSPLAELFARPNPYISGNKQMERIVMHLYLGGNALLSRVRPSKNAPTVELWPLPPDAVSVVPGRDSLIDRYVYEWDGVKRNFDPEEILHLTFTDPSNLYWGISPLQAIARTVDTDAEAVRWNKITLQNLARADGILSFKDPLTKEQYEEARAQVASQRAGSENAHGVWVLGSNASFTPITLSPAELDFIESRKMTREEILAVYGVPKAIVGLVEHATQSDVEAMERIFWRDTVITLLDDLKSAFNLALAPEYGDGIEIRYDVSNVDALRENYTEKVDQAQKLFAMGVPLNIIIDKLEMGIDEIEGGDTGYIAASLVPATGDIPEPEPVPEPLAQPDNPPELPPPDEEVVDGEEEPAAALEAASKNGHQKKAYGPEAKALHWKRLDRAREGYITALKKRAAARIREDGASTALAYAKGGQDAALRALDARLDGWETLLRASVTVVVEDFGERSYNDFAKATFDPSRPGIVSWIAGSVRDSARAIVDTSRNGLKRLLASLSGDEEPADVATNIERVFVDTADGRAGLIAVTEILAASNFGSKAGADQTGRDYEREWVTQHDEKVREPHEEADGQRVGKAERYTVGGVKCDFPGDPVLPLELRANCRCVEFYHPL